MSKDIGRKTEFGALNGNYDLNICSFSIVFLSMLSLFPLFHYQCWFVCLVMMLQWQNNIFYSYLKSYYKLLKNTSKSYMLAYKYVFTLLLCTENATNYINV